MLRQFRKAQLSQQTRDGKRRGGFMVLASICLVAGMAFVSLCVDVGYLSLSKQRMQNAVDAAAIAAAMEITNAIQNAGPDVTDVTAYSIAQARLKAKSVGELNGVYIDKDRDVEFGQRTLVGNTGTFTTTWGATPPNVVKVTAHRDKTDAALPDAQLNLFFSGLLGSKNASLVTSAAAYVESRDIVCVLDFSASMNDDSTYATLGTRDRTALEENMEDIYDILDGLHDFGELEFEPEWLTQTASSGDMNGSVVFRNTDADVTTSHNMTSVKYTYSDSSTSTNTYGYSENKTSVTKTSTKSINKVEATVQFQDWGPVASASNTSSGKTATVTFNGTSVDVTTSTSMSKVKLIYYPSGYTEVTAGGTTEAVSGNGSYISNVQVKMGSTWVTVNNPNGSSPEVETVTLVFNDNTTNVKDFFGLDVAWPWDSGSWDDFVSYCRSNSQIDDADYKRKYGGKCLVNYLLTQKPGFSQCEDLWRTPHYPFHSLKQGTELFAQFLDDLSFGDQMGMVSYATTAVDEHTLNYDGYSINMSSDPISDQFTNFKAIINHKQAGHYNTTTNIGGGIKQGKLMLDSHKRPGTQPTILLMTDGLANVRDTSYSLPGSWSWSTLFDYDGDGDADYTTSDDYCKYALGMAKQAVDAGYTIHTIGVGMGADNDLLQAIAWMGKGVHIEVPGDTTVEEMEEEVLEAFNQIAAFVPPARLVQE
jgi:Flp pilus assembly protein TadG